MHHFEERTFLPASAKEVFEDVDDPSHLSSHMSEGSWMMGGGGMNIEVDEGQGRAVGSHIRLGGKVFGIKLFLDEVVTHREPPRKKVWQTVGNPKLLVIGNYKMGFEIDDARDGSSLRVFIDYELPAEPSTRWLGYLLGGMYAKWCVRQMIKSAREQFKVTKN